MDYDKINTDGMIASSNSFLKERENGLYLSSDDISILEEFNIDYLSCKNIDELIYLISSYLDDSDDTMELEELNIKLGEYKYYHYTNK